MTEHMTAQHEARAPRTPNGLAVGLSAFAGVLMVMVGCVHALQGLVAVFQDEFYLTTPRYLVQLDTTTWGWTHLLLGLLVLLAGFAVLAGRLWGRTVGVVLAVVSALASIGFTPYYPFWSLTVVALDVLVIWALTAHGRDIARV